MVTEATEEVALVAAVATEEVGEFPVGLAEGAILVRCLSSDRLLPRAREADRFSA